MLMLPGRGVNVVKLQFLKRNQKRYLQYILKMWHEGERDRHWVMGQLERTFEDVGARLREGKKE
jgi:hypothetical protein